MDITKPIAALFDLDGVVLDTESQYTIFWDEQGRKYLGMDNFCSTIKGQTLTQILNNNFTGELESCHEQIIADLDRFERNMDYQYISGAQRFISELRQHGVKIAVVTSSNNDKMEHVYRVHPDFKNQFDAILTGDMFKRSKPNPDCFLLGMELFDAQPGNSFVFEDSFHGLAAGASSGAIVVGLATTNSRQSIEDKAVIVIDNFDEMTYDKLLQLS